MLAGRAKTQPKCPANLIGLKVLHTYTVTKKEVGNWHVGSRRAKEGQETQHNMGYSAVPKHCCMGTCRPQLELVTDQKAPVRTLTLSRDTLVVVLSYWKKPQTIHRVGRQNFIFNNYCFQRQMLSIRLREELWKLISSIHFTDENIKAQRREMIFPLLLCRLERNEAENPGALVPELGYNPLHTPSTHALHTVTSCPLSTILLLTLSSPPLTSLLKQELKSVSQEPPISNCGSCSPSSIFYHSRQVKPTEVEDTQMVLTHTLQSSPILCSITCGKEKLHGSGLQHCVCMCCPVHPCIGRKIVSQSQQQIIFLWLFLHSQF